MTPPRPHECSPRAIAAARRLVGPAKVLGGLAQVLGVASAVAAAVVSIALAVAAWRAEASGLVLGIVLVLAVVAFLPAWWLRHVRGVFRDLVDLPARLESLGHRMPTLTSDSRAELAALRTGGVVNAVRTLRSTIAGVADFVSPASSVVEVASPPFWIWTGAASIATAVLVVLSLLSPVILVFA